MARAKRWTIPFKSLNGTSCRIDIYDEGWTGTATELSTANANAPGVAAADPFYYEEDNDESLLQVIRYRTGYINLVETTYGGLADLYPETDTEHYVEFYYGSTLDFTGYIQAQSFENQWGPAPRLVSLPVQSPLGLCSGMYFTKAAPTIKYRADIFTEILSGLNAAYTGSVMPDAAATSFALKTNILCPVNEKINKLDGSDVYDPETYESFLESFCYLYGLILHDTPTKLVFSRFDEDGAYDGTTATGNTVRNISDYFSVAGDDNNESVVFPLKEIKIDYEGSALPSQQVSLDEMPFISKSERDLSVAAWFKMMSPKYSVNKPMDNYGIGNDNRPVSAGVGAGCVGGTGLQSEGIVVYPHVSWGSTDQLFEVKFYNYPILQEGERCILKIEMVRGDYLFNLPGSEDAGMFLDFSVDVDGEYYNIQTYEWDNTVHKLASAYGEPGNDGMWLRNVPDGNCMTVKFYYRGSTVLPTNKLALVTEVSLKPTVSNEWAYKFGNEQSVYLDGAEGSKNSGSFGLLFNRDHLNDHSVMWSYNLTGYVAPTFSYMFVAQHRLVVTMKATSFPADIYITKWAYWVTGWRWRVIAVTFQPWDDTYVITMHRSSTIEN